MLGDLPLSGAGVDHEARAPAVHATKRVGKLTVVRGES